MGLCEGGAPSESSRIWRNSGGNREPCRPWSGQGGFISSRLRNNSRSDLESRLGQAEPRRTPPVPRRHQESRDARGKEKTAAGTATDDPATDAGFARLVAATHGARIQHPSLDRLLQFLLQFFLFLG